MAHDGVRRATVQCRNESDAAGIMFVSRVIEARGWRQTHAVSLFCEGDDRAALPRPFFAVESGFGQPGPAGLFPQIPKAFGSS